jgi:2,5-diketo-D-gluconate reductase A
VLRSVGQAEAARRLLDELLEQGAASVQTIGADIVELAWLAFDLDRTAQLQRRIDTLPPSPWTRIATAIAGDDAEAAVGLLEPLGCGPAAASTRLRAGRAAARAGRLVDAEKHLDSAARTFAALGATRHLREIDQARAEFSRPECLPSDRGVDKVRAMTSGAAPRRLMADGNSIPELGLGTWPLDDAGAYATVSDALEAGYRLVDTATNYENEIGVGRAVRESGIPREEVFVTTKLPGRQHGRREALAGLDESLHRLGLDYVDLYLIHWPLPMVGKYVETWEALVELRSQGKARSIGVSNFTPAQIDEIVERTGVAPVVNQIEVHPEFAQVELRAWHDAHSIVTESYSPLGPDTDILSHPEIAAVAAAHGRTPAQVILRWHVQIGAVPIPKSADPDRLRQNLAVFDFELDPGQMAALDAVNRDNRTGGDPETNLEL